MGDILGVVHKNGNTKREEYDNIENYMYDLLVIGNAKKKAHIFLTVQTSLNIP